MHKFDEEDVGIRKRNDILLVLWDNSHQMKIMIVSDIPKIRARFVVVSDYPPPSF